MKLLVVFIPVLVLMFTGCAAKNELNVVKSYKTVNQYSSINITQGIPYGHMSTKLLDSFEDMLFDDLYAQKGAVNFVPGDQLNLKYEIVNIDQLEKSLTDWGTYFGKECSRFQILFTIYNKYGLEVGLYELDLDIEYWLFPSDEMVLHNAFEISALAISEHLKLNYLKR
ncbi:MAG: hypothetical protein U9N42_08570 [Campylobacterota bacterium]|nr:hypothetical protein [Campylobacterota bacterium]